MVTFKTIIVDDEREAREGLKHLLLQDAEMELLALCKNGLEAIQAINQNKPDLLFLDIQMPQVNGFEVLNSLPAENIPTTIFVTAYDQYALQAFEIHAIDYLLKPFTDERFYDCLSHAKKHLAKRDVGKDTESLLSLLDGYLHAQSNDTTQSQLISESPSPLHDRLVVKSGGKIHFVNYQDIVWIEANDYYVKVHLAGKYYLVRESMKGLEKKLPETIFTRIHKSSIINMTYIEELEPYFNGEYFVKLKLGQKLKLSRGYKDRLLGKFEI